MFVFLSVTNSKLTPPPLKKNSHPNTNKWLVIDSSFYGNKKSVENKETLLHV